MNNKILHNQLFYLTAAYFKEMIREPGVLFWGIVFPILMSLGLGIAFTKKTEMVRHVAVIEQQDGKVTSGNNDVIDRILDQYADTLREQGSGSMSYKITIPDEKLGNTVILFRKMDWEEALVQLKRGNMSVVLDDSAGQVRYHFDPQNPDAQLVYLKLARFFGNPGRETLKDQGEIRPLTVTGTRYIDFLVPGLVAMGIMMSTMWGLSYGIIDRRSKKLLRRMVATPMKKSNFLVSMITVRIGMNFIESALLALFAWLAFGISIQGSIPALLLIFVAGNMAFAGIAVFISSHTSNTEIGNGFINAVVMPMMVLSGIFFSYHNFPGWSIPFIKALPLTMLADGMRQIFIEGAGLQKVILPMLVLAATGVVFFTAGLKLFKWH